MNKNNTPKLLLEPIIIFIDLNNLYILIFFKKKKKIYSINRDSPTNEIL